MMSTSAPSSSPLSGAASASPVPPTVQAVPPAPATSRPSPAALNVWRLFLRAHATVIHELETELLVEQGLPLSFYDVLVQLVEAPAHRLRMTELADRVMLSRSGLTRLVDRLVRDGLVERQACAGDARGTFTVLTAAGVDRLRGAAPTHLRGVEEHMTSRLSPEELGEAGGRVFRLFER
jgi:DNA-binding MarR family transcriptional regulator